MMMAHDSTPTPPGALAEETIESVRGALAAFLRGSGDDGGALGAELRTMAREARGKALLPEQLLVVLKDIWYALPEVRRISDPAAQTRLLQRVVTICIEAYFAEAPEE